MRLAVLVCCLGSCLGLAGAAAQAKVPEEVAEDELLSPAATNNNLGPSGIVPVQRGLNAALITSSQHDSGSGWSNVLTPSVAYRLNRYLSVDASAPIFTYLNVAATLTGKAAALNPNALTTVHGLAGDTALAGHLEVPLGETFNYTFTPTLGMPSGSNAEGLGAGQVTYDFNNHVEADIPFSPSIEAGIGDSSGLLNRRVRRAQASVGPLAHFEFGLSEDMLYNTTLNLGVYEQLPIGDQNIYSTKTVNKKTVTKVTGTTGLAEDNGFTASLDIPLQRHVTLSGFYTRSLRQHDDVAGFSLTFLARGRPKAN